MAAKKKSQNKVNKQAKNKTKPDNSCMSFSGK